MGSIPRYAGFVAVLLFGLAASTAIAQEAATAPSAGPSESAATSPADEDGWRFSVAPYLWIARLDGKAGIGDIEEDVDIPFTDILKTLSLSAMMHMEARKNRFGFFANPFFVRTEDKSSGGVDVKVTNDTALIAGGAFYRIGEWQTGVGEQGRPLKIALEPYAGARFTYLRLEIDLSQGSGPTPGNALPQADRSKTWVDPIVGTRIGADLSENWLLFAAGDVGGFGVGTDYSWNAQGYVGYRGSAFGVPATYVVGYRGLHQDYDKNNFKWDVTQHGPMLGAAFHF